ncbi:DUF986 family protein [Suttonella ornithocola]|uniref:UPF0266 membrane protein YobD n=1 Tax=Suttonella ornithocola TaxID=279832 RepID=A0A380MUL0_9GAMM|nr:DUF986 family protein [Suttonella ornithocola]SUO95603.1 Predicted membrane protein [Suttonella ornithocola]
MFWVNILIWLIALVYLIYLLSEKFYLPDMVEPTLVKPALRRRLADSLMIFGATLYGIYTALTNQQYTSLLAPLTILAITLLILMIRHPKWHLKENGFVYYFRYVPYSAITHMQLAQNGVLLITLNNGGKIPIAFANIAAVETAANFFTNEKQLENVIKS